MKRFQKENGFTLVEMMIVLVIIGIIMAIAIPSLMASRETAWKQTCDGNLRGLNSAAAMYYVQTNGTYPTGVGELVAKVTGFDNPILQAEPKCPKDPTTTYAWSATDRVFTCTVTGHGKAAATPPPAGP